MRGVELHPVHPVALPRLSDYRNSHDDRTAIGKPFTCFSKGRHRVGRVLQTVMHHDHVERAGHLIPVTTDEVDTTDGGAWWQERIQAGQSSEPTAAKFSQEAARATPHIQNPLRSSVGTLALCDPHTTKPPN